MPHDIAAYSAHEGCRKVIGEGSSRSYQCIEITLGNLLFPGPKIKDAEYDSHAKRRQRYKIYPRSRAVFNPLAHCPIHTSIEAL